MADHKIFELSRIEPRKFPLLTGKGNTHFLEEQHLTDDVKISPVFEHIGVHS